MSCNQMAFNGMPAFFPQNLVFHAPLDDTQHQHHHNSLASMLPANSPDLRAGLNSSMLGKRSMTFAGFETCDELNMEDELSDEPGERKKRLNLEQVRILEKNFEMGNKLEPERKLQLSRALGLQPRQIAIWFQNKRARWKTKQLEKDYDLLKRQFDAVKAENDALQTQNKRLHAEILALKGMEAVEPINLNKETEGSCSNKSDNCSDVHLDMSRIQTTTDSSPCQQQGQIFFPAFRPPNAGKLLHYGKNVDNNQCPKVEQGYVQEENNICNVLGSVDDQSAFWSWSEQHNFQ